MPAGTYTIRGSFDTGPLAGDLEAAKEYVVEE